MWYLRVSNWYVAFKVPLVFSLSLVQIIGEDIGHSVRCSWLTKYGIYKKAAFIISRQDNKILENIEKIRSKLDCSTKNQSNKNHIHIFRSESSESYISATEKE